MQDGIVTIFGMIEKKKKGASVGFCYPSSGKIYFGQV